MAGLQVPARWHASEGLHTTGLAPVQVPIWQVSVCVRGVAVVADRPRERGAGAIRGGAGGDGASIAGAGGAGGIAADAVGAEAARGTPRPRRSASPLTPCRRPRRCSTAAPAHSLSGSVSLVMLPHVPLAPPFLAALHAWQVALHAVLQQTPSAQKPLAQSLACTQGAPKG